MTTSLPTTRLGWTDMLLTRVGFGAWALGGGGWAYAWGSQDDTESIAAIRHAVESGVNWIDTAAVYGLGHFEEVVAAALVGIPEADRPYVFTKGGLVWDPADRTYQMHWPAEDGTVVEEYWQVFLDLKREGKVRAVGLSNHDIYQLEAAEGVGNVDAIQPQFNLIHRDGADDVLLWHASMRPALSSTARWPRACSQAPSPPSAPLAWSRGTGGLDIPTSPGRRCRRTWR
jgi:aryl-alcohol dehydrogenase-like predicted oxidoreductase